MTINKIEKKCPICNCPDSDIIGAMVGTKEGKRVSYNVYKCLANKHRFLVKRKGDEKEQKLTEKYIKSKKITLN